MKTFSIRFRLTEADYRAVVPKLLIRNTFILTMSGFGFLFLLTSSLASVKLVTMTEDQRLLCFILGLFCAVLPAMMALAATRRIKFAQSAFQPVEYIFTDKAIEMHTGNDSAQLPWENIYKIVVTGHHVLIYIARNSVKIIPREAISDDQVREVLNRRHLK